MEAYEIQLSSAKHLSPYLEKKRVEWAGLIQEMSEQYEFCRIKLRQKSPSFEYQNWRCNVEHMAEFGSVVLSWRGEEGSCPRPHPYWAGVSRSDVEQGWTYRRELALQDFAALLEELRAR
jgi:hypothetical protein